jgi:alkylhydroperoxidase family enzyme
MSDIRQAREALVQRILKGKGTASRAQRRAAFDNTGLVAPLSTLIEKVATRSNKVTDEDIKVARASGLSEDQIFELLVCAAVGQATREYETALRELAAVSKKE